MNNNNSCCNKSKLAVYAIAILGSFLIMAALVKIMQNKTATAIGADRAEERRKNLVTVRAETDQALKNYAWQDQGKGLVRLPVARAMEVALQEWQNPQAARSNLNLRVDKANAPAPKAPEKPSEFE